MSIFRLMMVLFAVALVMYGLSQPTRSLASSGGGTSAEAGKAEGKDGKKDEKKKSPGGEDEILGGKFEGDPVYVRMKPMVLPVIAENGAQQLVTIQVDLQVKDMATADGLYSSMPRLRDSVTSALYGGFGDGSLLYGHTLNLEAIKDRVSSVVKKLSGEDSLKEVLIQGVAQRML